MGERMTESEDKVVTIVLNIEPFCSEISRALRGQGSFTYYRNRPHQKPFYVVCLNRKERRYGIEFNGKVLKEFCIPETFFQVMDDIENGKILQSDTAPNLRIKFTKSYEVYQTLPK